MIVEILCAGALQLAGRADTLDLTMADAASRAVAASPVVAAAAGAVRAPLGLQAEWWGPFASNPVVEVGGTRRRAAPGTFNDRAWTVSQELEPLAWWERRRAAGSEVAASEARRRDAERIAALDARRAYIALAIAQRRVALADSAATFAERLASYARRQFEAGEANRLELNATVLEAARARSVAERADAARTVAAAEVARLLALPAGVVPRATDLPSLPDPEDAERAGLVEAALSNRPDMRAAETARQSAERRLRSAKLALLPNVTIAATGGQESGTDRLAGVQVGLQLPLFHRQQAAMGEFDAARIAAISAATAARRAIRAEVEAALALYRRGRSAELRFATNVLPSANDNVRLVERALVEGEVSLTEVLVLRGTAVAAQLEYLDVLQGAVGAWVELAAAVSADPSDLNRILKRGN